MRSWPIWKRPSLVVEIEDRDIDLAHSDRSKTPIEPILDRSVVRQDGRVGPIGDGRRDRRPREDHSRPLRQGLSRLAQRESADWPIGRQLWWGHRIPVWVLSPLANKAPFASRS